MRHRPSPFEEFPATGGLSNPHRRGLEFQSFVEQLFRRAHFRVRVNSGTARPRQTDVLALKARSGYLVETKWKKPVADINDIDALFARLERVPHGVLGLFISVSGFSRSAIDRVEARRSRPMLLVTGGELERALDWGGDFMRLLSRKEDGLLVDGRMFFGSERPRRRRVRSPKPGALPDSDFGIVLADGTRPKWLVGGGGFGEVVFVSELIDVDWVPAPGSGVTLSVEVGWENQDGLIRILEELSNTDWTTGSGRWSIQQARDNWHGVGVGTLAEAVVGWEGRYRKVAQIHHTEQVRYYDRCDGGFYTLSADLSASSRRLVRRCEIAFELIGVPMDAEPFRRLCESLDVDGPFYWRPRVEKSVESGWMDRNRRVTLHAEAFVVERNDQRDSPESEWVVGIAAANPYHGEQGIEVAGRPQWWPEAVYESELLICDLRSNHPLAEPRSRYWLQSCQWAWASDVLVFRPVADW